MKIWHFPPFKCIVGSFVICQDYATVLQSLHFVLQLLFELLLPTLNFVYLAQKLTPFSVTKYIHFLNIDILYASMMNGLVLQKFSNTGMKR